MPVTQIGFGMLVQRQHNSSFTNNGLGENDAHTCVIGVFRALNILNGYVQSVLMERARNFDSETHMKKYNRTSGTDLS